VGEAAEILPAVWVKRQGLLGQVHRCVQVAGQRLLGRQERDHEGVIGDSREAGGEISRHRDGRNRSRVFEGQEADLDASAEIRRHCLRGLQQLSCPVRGGVERDHPGGGGEPELVRREPGSAREQGLDCQVIRTVRVGEVGERGVTVGAQVHQPVRHAGE
jgi:hypothetical protein